MNRVITRVRHVTQFGTVTGWSEDKSLMPSWRSQLSLVPVNVPTAGSMPLGPKCAAEELTTRSPRVADRSLCLLPTDVTGWQRSAIYGGAGPWSALNVSRHNLNWMLCGTRSQWRQSRSTCLMRSCFSSGGCC